MKGVVKAETKAALQLTSYIWEIDYRSLREARPVYVTTVKVETQGKSIKDLKNEKLKLKI